jgi:hypothetical protein
MRLQGDIHLFLCREDGGCAGGRDGDDSDEDVAVVEMTVTRRAASMSPPSQWPKHINPRSLSEDTSTQGMVDGEGG